MYGVSPILINSGAFQYGGDRSHRAPLPQIGLSLATGFVATVLLMLHERAMVLGLGRRISAIEIEDMYDM